MEYRTNFFKKVMTSIYDIKIFSKYAKEGIFRSISYAMLLTLILVGVKDISIGYKTENIEIISFIYIISRDFGLDIFKLIVQLCNSSYGCINFYNIHEDGS